MPRKKPPPTERAAEQADFKSWLADAVAALQREHNVNPGIIPVRVWRRLFIQGRSPREAAKQAAMSAYKMSAYNKQSAADRLRGPQAMSDELPFKFVRSHDHDHDEVLARAVNLLIARYAYREAAPFTPTTGSNCARTRGCLSGANEDARPRQDRAPGGLQWSRP
jgi:hypothetical protein